MELKKIPKWKLAQRADREKLRKVRVVHAGGIADLGIKAFKRLGKTSAEIAKFKDSAWKNHAKGANK